MANKYHISPSTGNPNICRANSKPCPYGGADAHFSSKAEARKAYEAGQEGALKSVSAGDGASILSKHGLDPEAHELFTSPSQAVFGSRRYFEEAMDAGFYGLDDSGTVAFRVKS